MTEQWPTETNAQGDDFESGLREILSTLRTSSPSRLITISVAVAFVLTCLRTAILARVYGYSAPDSDEGAKSLITTWFTLSAGFVPLALAISKHTLIRESGLGSLLGLVLGGLYGLIAGEILTCGLCGACIGAFTGFTLGRNGIHPNRQQAKLFIGTVVGAYAFFVVGGFMKPVALVPVGEARRDAEKRRPDERLMSPGGGISSPSPTRQGLSERSKEIIADYRRQNGFGTDGERNMRVMLEESEKYERKLRE